MSSGEATLLGRTAGILDVEVCVCQGGVGQGIPMRSQSPQWAYSLVLYSNKKEQPHGRVKLASYFKENLRIWQAGSASAGSLLGALHSALEHRIQDRLLSTCEEGPKVGGLGALFFTRLCPVFHHL